MPIDEVTAQQGEVADWTVSAEEGGKKANTLSACRLIHADCLGLEGLKILADNSANLVLSDPPYFLDGMDNKWCPEKLKQKVKKAGAIGGLPVGMKFDPRQGRMLEEFISEVAIELLRVIIPGGFLLFFMQPRLYDPMATAVRNAGFEVRDGLAWQHGGGQGKAFTLNHCVRKMKIPQEEKDALIASMKGGTTPQLRPVQEWMVLAQKPKEGTFVENWQKWRTGLVWPNFPNGQQTTVFSYMKPNSRKTIDHLTIKPVELMEQLLRVFSIEGHTVVDPFMGSGTTGVACARTGRKFVGFEIDRGYFDLAARRIAEARQTLGKNCPVPSTDGRWTCLAEHIPAPQEPTCCAGPEKFTGCTGRQGPAGYAEQTGPSTVPLAENLDGLHG